MEMREMEDELHESFSIFKGLLSFTTILMATSVYSLVIAKYTDLSAAIPPIEEISFVHWTAYVIFSGVNFAFIAAVGYIIYRFAVKGDETNVPFFTFLGIACLYLWYVTFSWAGLLGKVLYSAL